MTIAREALQEHAKKTVRIFKNRYKAVGASEIGQCERKIGYLKHDNPEDSNFNPNHVDSWGASRRGTIIENHFFVPAMKRKYGDKLLYVGKSQKTLRQGYLSATPDGLLIDQPRNALAGLMVPDIGASREIVVEFKSIDPRIRLSEPRPEHVFQVQTQLGLFRECTEHRPDFAVIIYVNASFLDDGLEFAVEYDPTIFAHAQKRAERIMSATKAAQLKPEGWIAGGKECEYCPFFVACQQLRTTTPSTASQPDPQIVAELVDMAVEYTKLKAKASNAETECRKVAESIKERMREKGLRRIDDNGTSIVWSEVAGRPAWDMPALKAAAIAAGIDIEQFTRVGEPTDRLVVQVRHTDRLVKSTGGKLPAD